MADLNFYHRMPPISLQKLAEIAGATLHQGTDGLKMIEDVASLNLADENSVSFLDNVKYVDDFNNSKAGAIILRPAMIAHANPNQQLLICDKPYHGFAKMAAYFYPANPAKAGIHPSAVIGEGCLIDKDAEISPNCTIGNKVTIGQGSRIDANCVIGDGVQIGKNCRVEAGVSIHYALIADNCLILEGARIGTRGFGFAMDESGHIELPQLGRVLIGNNVEIGANTTIDRGMGPDTIISDHCRLDNMVQIAHNVVLGKGCVIAAQVGISGSTKLGDYVTIGGQAGIAGHLKIGSRIMIAAKSGVTKNIPDGQIIGGFPALPIKEWRYREAVFRRLTKKSNAEI